MRHHHKRRQTTGCRDNDDVRRPHKRRQTGIVSEEGNGSEMFTRGGSENNDDLISAGYREWKSGGIHALSASECAVLNSHSSVSTPQKSEH